MKNSYEIIKFVFDDSKIINNSLESWDFLNQILNADTKNFKLDVDDENDLFVWLKGIWLDGIWKYGYWYDGIWHNGVWEYGYWYDGTWKDGIWHNGNWKRGTWYNGVWEGGYIWNPKTKQFEYSKVPPDKCQWSILNEK